ncbi:MAG: hypothetical protein ACOVQ4_16340 [Flectobacillus sp.]|uniref:hypothetical protein n=1 Tax=Flectobacillus sp. TaxID=50419 RepID=UPI003B990EB1
MNLVDKGFGGDTNLKWWHILLVLFPILFYYSWVWYFGVDCPQLDDFGVLLNLVDVSNASNFTEKLRLVFSPHNEHRIVFTKLAFSLVGLTDKGAVDIYKVLFLGNLTLIGIACIFYKAIVQIKQSWIYALAISCMLFQMQFFENTFFGMASVQNIGVYLWLGLSCWKIAQIPQDSKQLKWAFLFGVFATLTSGNGMVVFPAGAFTLWIAGTRKFSVIWTISGIIVVLTYLYGLQHQSHNTNPAQVLQGAMGYLGSLIGLSTGKWIPVIVGGIMLSIGVILNLNLVFVQFTSIKVFSKPVQLFLFTFFMVMIATGCMIAINRDVILAISIPRYKIGSAVVGCLLILMIANTQLSQRNSFLIGLICAIGSSLFCLMTYYKMTPIIKANQLVYLNNIQAFRQKTLGQTHAPILFEKEWFDIWKAGKWKLPETKQ